MNSQPWSYDDVTRLTRVMRALDTAGMYNASKVLRAAAFSLEIRERNRDTLSSSQLNDELGAVIDRLEASGLNAAAVDALRRGLEAVIENRSIHRSTIPEVLVCRDCGEIFMGHVPNRCPGCGARRITLREFSPVYFLEPMHPRETLAALASAPDELDRLGGGLSEEQMQWRPGRDRWSIRDVLAHLLAVQGLLAGRVEKMLAEERPSLVAVHGASMKDGMTASQLLAAFRKSRGTLVGVLKRIPFEDWWRRGEHEEFGEVTILQQASYFAKHERYHLPGPKPRAAWLRREEPAGPLPREPESRDCGAHRADSRSRRPAVA